MPEQEELVPNISLWQAVRYWFKLGCISFGGPAGQIAIMHEDLVEKRCWISERRFLHALNYCMLLPGPEAQQLATYIGWLMHRTWGGLIAGGLFVLPSLLLLVLLSWVYLRFGEVPAVAAVLYGIKPAVVGIVAFAAWRIGRRVLNNALLCAISLMAFLALTVFHLPFPYVILCAAIIGVIGGKFAPRYFRAASPGHAPSAAEHHAPALIADDTPPPPHARFQLRKLLLALGCGLLIWIMAMAVLRWSGQPVLLDMASFFSKAALLTFGGAYAVLPYLYQGAVQSFAWLSPAQMMDGLALGETTPGPLIMVVAFVGFVGGWGQALFGADQLLWAGIAAACVVTFFTFLPSFIFIFAGGPLVESTRGDLRFTAPLTAITAAVVGVILNLAVFFAMHITWPQGMSSTPDWFALFASVLALILLIRFRLGVLMLIGLFALLGLAYRLMT